MLKWTSRRPVFPCEAGSLSEVATLSKTIFMTVDAGKVTSRQHMKGLGVVLLCTGTLLTAAGYGATFLMTEHFRALGGGEIETGRTLGGAMVGTFVGVSLVGTKSRQFGAAPLAAIGAVVVALGYLILASLTSVSGLIVPA